MWFWLTELSSTHANVVIVLKASWQSGSNSIFVYDLLGEPGRTPLFVDIPSAWGSVNGDHILVFSPCFVGELFKWGL